MESVCKDFSRQRDLKMSIAIIHDAVSQVMQKCLRGPETGIGIFFSTTIFSDSQFKYNQPASCFSNASVKSLQTSYVLETVNTVSYIENMIYAKYESFHPKNSFGINAPWLYTLSFASPEFVKILNLNLRH